MTELYLPTTVTEAAILGLILVIVCVLSNFHPTFTCEVLWWHSLWAACIWMAWPASSHRCMGHQQEPKGGKGTVSENRQWRQSEQCNLLETTYSILVDDIDNGHQLASMGSKRDVGNATDLYEAFEHLKNIKKINSIFVKWHGNEHFKRQFRDKPRLEQSKICF